MRRLLTIVLPAVLLLATPSAVDAADRVHCKDGRILEGTALIAADGSVELQAAYGSIRIAKDEVIRVERDEATAKRIAALTARADAGELEALVELARLHAEAGRAADAGATWTRVIAAEPDHPEAREALGHVRGDDGTWRTAEEDAARRGLVRHGSRFVTPEEKATLLAAAAERTRARTERKRRPTWRERREERRREKAESRGPSEWRPVTCTVPRAGEGPYRRDGTVRSSPGIG